MAEENQEGQEGGEKKKGKGMLFAIIGLVVVGGGGAFFAMKGGGEQAAEDPAAEEASVGDLPGAIYPLEVFIVNLGVKGSFLKVAIQLEFLDPDPPAGVDAEIPRVRDSIIQTLSSKTSAEILTVEGKENLRKEVTEAANEAFGREEVLQVYFTEFIVQ